MITLVEALNYRCLRYVQTPLKPFHVLVGPNASGKSTFLDVIGFLSDLVSDGPDQALMKRASNPRDLLFRGEGDRFEMAVEAKIPDELRQLTSRPELEVIRYQIAIGFDNTQRQFEIKAETLLLKRATKVEPIQRSYFPEPPNMPESLQVKINSPNNKTVINKVIGGNDNFYSEVYKKAGKGWSPSLRLGSKKSALGNLFDDSDSFPVAIWFQSYLTKGLQRLMINSLRISQPSPPAWVSGFLPDGSNLPWVAARLRKEHPKQHLAWIGHLRTALPDLVDITTFERPEDRHRYMFYEYRGGYKIPSWLASDGTLRLTALTLPAYLVGFRGMYLIEEPENGIHPRDISTVYDSLCSVYDSQVLVATHSPAILDMTRLEDVLCFAKDEEGLTDIVSGSDHPMLRHWDSVMELGTLLGSGILG